ncbi:MAG: hypothetical protein ACFE75_13600 [Candidatus Hodarchaeota archaeon]
MKIKINSRLKIVILIIIAITGFSLFVFEIFNETSDDNIMNSPKLSSPSFITITTPDSSTLWNAGDDVTIVYSVSSDILSVNITLYEAGLYLGENGLDEWSPVTPNFWWNIPEDLEPSQLYQIKISNYYNQSFYVMSDEFEIGEPIAGLATAGLGELGAVIVLTSLGVIVGLCITNRIVRGIILKKRRRE